MPESLKVIIDITAPNKALTPSQQEEQSLALAEEMRLGKLVYSAQLARETELPEGAKSGLAAFVGSLLTAEISRENLKKALDFLGNRFYGKSITMSYEADGESLKYSFSGKPEELDKALAAVERLENIRIQVSNSSVK